MAAEGTNSSDTESFNQSKHRMPSNISTYSENFSQSTLRADAPEYEGLGGISRRYLSATSLPTPSTISMNEQRNYRAGMTYHPIPNSSPFPQFDGGDATSFSISSNTVNRFFMSGHRDEFFASSPTPSVSFSQQGDVPNLRGGFAIPAPLNIPPYDMASFSYHDGTQEDMISVPTGSANLQHRASFRPPALSPVNPAIISSMVSMCGGKLGQDQVRSPGRRGPAGGKSPRERHLSDRALESADGFVYQVHFKRAHRNFLLAPTAPRDIEVGDFVKVEADRGEDLGIVVAKVLATNFEEFVPTAGYRGRGFSSGQGDKKFILRPASNSERAGLLEKVKDEERALATIRSKVVERRLPMVILDAEYQFDRHKMVFFFEADKRIDFRELVSDLFSQYKTRIWMQQVDTTILPDHEVRTQIARLSGFLPSSYSRQQLDLEDIAFYSNFALEPGTKAHGMLLGQSCPADALGRDLQLLGVGNMGTPTHMRLSASGDGNEGMGSSSLSSSPSGREQENSRGQAPLSHSSLGGYGNCPTVPRNAGLAFPGSGPMGSGQGLSRRFTHQHFQHAATEASTRFEGSGDPNSRYAPDRSYTMNDASSGFGNLPFGFLPSPSLPPLGATGGERDPFSSITWERDPDMTSALSGSFWDQHPSHKATSQYSQQGASVFSPSRSHSMHKETGERGGNFDFPDTSKYVGISQMQLEDSSGMLPQPLAMPNTLGAVRNWSPTSASISPNKSANSAAASVHSESHGLPREAKENDFGITFGTWSAANGTGEDFLLEPLGKRRDGNHNSHKGRREGEERDKEEAEADDGGEDTLDVSELRGLFSPRSPTRLPAATVSSITNPSDSSVSSDEKGEASDESLRVITSEGMGGCSGGSEHIA